MCVSLSSCRKTKLQKLINVSYLNLRELSVFRDFTASEYFTYSYFGYATHTALMQSLLSDNNWTPSNHKACSDKNTEDALISSSFTHCTYFTGILTIFIKSKEKLATLDEGDQKALFSIATTPRCRGGLYSFPSIAPLYPWYCWVLSKDVSSTIFIVFSVTLLGIEPRSPRQLANTLPTWPINEFVHSVLYQTYCTNMITAFVQLQNSFHQCTCTVSAFLYSLHS